MKLTREEVDFLAAWAREEQEPACYQLPAHRLQLAHGVVGARLLLLIKAWTRTEGKKDQDMLAAATNPQPPWPWATAQAFVERLALAEQLRASPVRAEAGPAARTLAGLGAGPQAEQRGLTAAPPPQSWPKRSPR